MVLEAIDVKINSVQAIIVSPTREIALQSSTVIRQLGAFMPGLKCELFVGGILSNHLFYPFNVMYAIHQRFRFLGLPLSVDIKALESCHIAIGTPGRLKSLIYRGHLNCEHARLFVLDEADLLFSGNANLTATSDDDHMEELLQGKNTFPATINYIWWALPENKQVIALSATYTAYLVEHHLPRYLNQPTLVRLSADDPSLIGSFIAQ